jgi:hypothetical protein
MIKEMPLSYGSEPRYSGSSFAFRNPLRVVGQYLPVLLLALVVIQGAPLLAEESADVGRGLAESSIQGVLTGARPDGQSATLGSGALSTFAGAPCPSDFDQLGAGTYRCGSRTENSQTFLKTLALGKSEARVESTPVQPKQVDQEGEGSRQAPSPTSWTLELWTGYSHGLYEQQWAKAFDTTGTHIWFTGVRLGKVLTREHGHGLWRGNLEYAFDIIPAALAGNRSETYGGGFNVFVFKWNFAPRQRVAPYFEMAGGCFFTKAEIPAGTSNVNFTAQGGPGLRILLHHGHAITVSAKFFHLSNALLAYTNPGVNGVQVTIGHQWSW